MLDALTLDQMRAFVAVVENGSFRAGAERLSRVQSAISHAIGNLEAQLNVALFDRSGHKPALTPEGRALLADVRAILIKVDAMRARARGFGEGLELSLAVAVDPIIPTAIVATALADLRNRYPSVSVALSTAPLGAAAHAIMQGNCALAVTTADFPEAEIEAEALGALPPFVAVCAVSHPLAAGGVERWSAAALADHLQILVADPSPVTQGQTYGVLSPGTWRVADLATKLELIRAGIGWGNLPLWMVERDLGEGRLCRVRAAALGESSETAMNAYLLRRFDTSLGPAARFLRERLFDRFRAGREDA